MKKSKLYTTPQADVISIEMEHVLQETSTTHEGNVQDEYIDEDIEDDASFGFSKTNDWTWEE